MVVNPGRDRRAELCRLTGLDRKPISWSTSTSAAMGRATSTGRGWNGSPRAESTFLSYHPVPAGRLDNLHVVPSADWPGGDLIASSDAILAKAGYGTSARRWPAERP